MPHPLFTTKFGAVIVDEIHMARNGKALLCNALRCVNAGFRPYGVGTNPTNATGFVLGLSGTPVINEPKEMAAQCKAMGLQPSGHIDFQDPKAWTGADYKQLNIGTCRAFSECIHKTASDAVKLPEIHESVQPFKPNLGINGAVAYNDVLDEASALAVRADGEEASGGKFISLLIKLQQMLVSPRLAGMGAKQFLSDPRNLDLSAVDAGKLPGGALGKLYERLSALMTNGQHARVIVACERVAEMRLAAHWLRCKARRGLRTSSFIFEGSLSLDERERMKRTFLATDNAILFLSVKAGGTGLHIVPGCNAMLFWGARSFSPATVFQCLKRIHRIGQTKPVYVEHIMAEGSVDWAIDKIHADKARVATAIVDSDYMAVDEDGTWKKAKRILAACRHVNDDGSAFLEEEEEEEEA
jgi:hypothetical protein